LQVLEHGHDLAAGADVQCRDRFVEHGEHDVYVHVDSHSEAELVPGILVVGIDGPLFFADADNFRTSVLQLVKSNQPRVVILDLTATNMIDMDGERTLAQLARELGEKHIRVLLVKVGTDSIELLRSTGTLDHIGAENLHRTVHEAVASARTAARAPDGDGIRDPRAGVGPGDADAHPPRRRRPLR
jgi:MFS superfamily sulfate permease-like transporter